jgi:hypothetical protein
MRFFVCGRSQGRMATVNDEDFCLEHGRDFMRCDKGPIPYCAKCEDDMDAIKEAMIRDDDGLSARANAPSECVIIFRNPHNRVIGYVSDGDGDKIAVYRDHDKAVRDVENIPILRVARYQIVELDDLRSP